MTDDALIFEMSPRDGLQNEPRPVSTADKIRLVDLLTDCGFKKIEAASFVSPKAVPQMADGAEVMAGIARGAAAYTALTPNMKGYERARAAHADEVAIFGSASEGFSQANIKCSIAESIERFRPIVEAAKADGVPVRGYISCVAVCPYDGPTPPAAVARIAETLLALGCYELSLGDTIGAGEPDGVRAMLDAVLAIAPPARLAGHFHDTNGRAIENISVCLERGLRTFDAAVGGLGGCPFAPGARGNVATEAVVDFVERRGLKTGVDRGKLTEAAAFAQGLRSDARAV